MSPEELNKPYVPMDGTAIEPVTVAATGTAIERAMDEAMQGKATEQPAEQAATPTPRQELYDVIDQAVEARRFCVAVFRLVPDANPNAPARIHLNFRTNDFPTGDFPKVLTMLRERLSAALKEHLAGVVQASGNPVVK